MSKDNESEAVLTEIPASEILEKIQKGEPVKYDHVIVKGYLDISALALPMEDEKPVICSEISITNSQIDGNANFDNIIFKRYVNFENTHFNALASFVKVQFNWFHNISDHVVNFKGAKFDELAHFYGACFNGGSIFKEARFGKFGGYLDRAKFSDYALFDGAQFEGDAYFKRTLFCGLTRFRNVQFKGHTHFRYAKFRQYTSFEDAHFKEPIYLDETKFQGDHLTFRNAAFSNPLSQEDACRRAKNVLAKAGNRDEEEYHFYREMEAKRIQKGVRGSDFAKDEIMPALINSMKTREWSNFKNFFLYDILEFIFVQKIFGYGVHPFWLFGWWLVIVLAFAVIYGISGKINEASQWYDYIWFSIATAATPGYALYKPIDEYRIVAGIEAILGTFMWVTFITTFARKFMR